MYYEKKRKNVLKNIMRNISRNIKFAEQFILLFFWNMYHVQ